MPCQPVELESAGGKAEIVQAVGAIRVVAADIMG